MDEALIAVERQKQRPYDNRTKKLGVAYAAGCRKEALQRSAELRGQGFVVVDALESMSADEAKMWAKIQKLAKLYFIDNNMEDEQVITATAVESDQRTEEQDG